MTVSLKFTVGSVLQCSRNWVAWLGFNCAFNTN